MKSLVAILLFVFPILKVSDARSRPKNVELEAELLSFWPGLFQSDTNGLGKEIVLNLQSKTNRTSSDNAAEPLFRRVPYEQFTSLPTYATMLNLFDNYEAAVNRWEEVTGEELDEQDEFINAILNTDVMRKAHEFLVMKGRASPDVDDFAEYLKAIWFGLYSRSHGVLGSSGFEHVFLGELKNEVTGLHSWVRYSIEENNGNVNYLGYLNISPIGDDYVIEIPIYWRKVFKNISSILVGTSPELEIALYTVCFTLMPGQLCPVQRNGDKRVSIQTAAFENNGQSFIGTAYPTLQ